FRVLGECDADLHQSDHPDGSGHHDQQAHRHHGHRRSEFMSRICPTRRRSQRGMALISSLLLLLVVTIMAVSMFRSYGMQEKIAGNTREKQRALNAAVSAQQYAEWLLQSGTAPPTAACNALVPATTPQVCNNALNALGPAGIGDYTILPWA